MIRSIIVEDDPLHRERLINLIKQTGLPVSILSTPKNVDEGLKAITEFTPELVFLDVELERGESGFDLLKRIDKINFEVIFTTAHTKEAINAFRLCALDFLPKPLIFDELMAALGTFLKRKNEKNRNELLETFVSNLQTGSKKQIMIFDENSYWQVKTENIIYCESDNEITDFYFANPVANKSKLTSSIRIGEWEKLLAPFRICRIHNSLLVNVDHILKYYRGDGGYVIVSSGESLSVSKGRKENFLIKLGLK